MTAEALELLAPAKTALIGMEAIRHGADAVYIGGPAFGARAAAGNSMRDIAALCEYAHRFRARVLMTLNTILADEELPAAEKLAREAWDAGVDALIVQDPGLLRAQLPPIALHASTQCDIRTPEKALLLEQCGFSQIVPARELTLAEIDAIHRALTRARIEFFVHGALCVSYSGQCYASKALRGRSANRGQCAQICRLAFDVRGPEGELLRSGCHALSLRDNDQSRNLAELIAAGVRSFKIEGRLKDADYVKNVTAHYRRLLDRFLGEHPEYTQESKGETRLFFEPDPSKSFNRGSTDYFVHGRQDGLADFSTPKNAGEPAGTVRAVGPRSFTLRSRLEFHNGDGLTFTDARGVLAGILVNRAEKREGQTWEIFTRDSPRAIPGLAPGTQMRRNRDAAWLKLMAGETAERTIALELRATVSPQRITLKATDPEGIAAETTATGEFPPADNPEKAREQAARSLARLGGTIYRAGNVRVESGEPLFVPASLLNSLRRELIQALDQKRRLAFRRWERLAAAPAEARDRGELDYRGNVFNREAAGLLASLGYRVTERAFETGENTAEVELMRCRYCLRHALSLCPKEAAKRGEKIKPLPLTLTSGAVTLTCRFHCKPCEMSVHGRRSAPSTLSSIRIRGA